MFSSIQHIYIMQGSSPYIFIYLFIYIYGFKINQYQSNHHTKFLIISGGPKLGLPKFPPVGTPFSEVVPPLFDVRRHRVCGNLCDQMLFMECGEPWNEL